MSKIKNAWIGKFINAEYAALDIHVDDEYHYDKYKAEHNWEIRDATGVLHAGKEHEMMVAWRALTTGSLEEFLQIMNKDFPNIDRKLLHEAYAHLICDIEGDLELIQVHQIHFNN